MSKVSTTLKNIENNQDEEKQRKQKKEQEKQLKKEYDGFLIESITNVISIAFEFSNNIDDTFNDLIINDFKYKKQIESTILNEKTESDTWEKIKNDPIYAEKWEDKKEFTQKFKKLYNINDIGRLYIPTAKKIYNNYKLKQELNNKNIEKELLKNFDYILIKSKNFDAIVKELQKTTTKINFCKELANNINDYNYLYYNYNSILKKWYTDNKNIIKEKEVKQPKKSSGLIGGLIGWWLGGKL